MEVNFVCSIEQDDAFQEGWMWHGEEKNFDLSFHKSVVTELATCGISGIDKLFDDSEVGSNEGEEVGYECEAGPVQSFTKVHSAYETAMSFFMHHTNEHNRIFFLGSGTLFHIKCEVSTKQLLVADSVERRDWHTGIELMFCMYTLYVGPSGECISLIFYSFLMFLTYLMLSHNCHFPCLASLSLSLSLFPHCPFRNDG